MPGKKILVAEDDVDIRNLIGYTLQYNGYQVVEATNGVEAVEKARAERPDLIILDVRMPKLDGLEACILLRNEDSTRDIPIIFLSARGQEAEIKRGLALGAAEYILKPFPPEDLGWRVGSVLQRERGR